MPVIVDCLNSQSEWGKATVRLLTVSGDILRQRVRVQWLGYFYNTIGFAEEQSLYTQDLRLKSNVTRTDRYRPNGCPIHGIGKRAVSLGRLTLNPVLHVHSQTG